VVSVGSLLVGGAGKTPLAAALAGLAREEGLRPAILLRGYGGRVGRGVQRVAPNPGPAEVRAFGDEACLHARMGEASVYVGADRITACEKAARDQCGLAILDDGMQHRAIGRDVEIVSLPGDAPLGNGRLLPRGPLREPEIGLIRANLIVLAHTRAVVPPAETTVLLRRLAPRVQVLSWKGAISLRALTGAPPPHGSRIALLSGIGRPDTFRTSMERDGFQTAFAAEFADHHRFTQSEVDAVRKMAGAEGIDWVVTTAKDEMRLLGLELGERPAFVCADLRIVWNEPSAEGILRRSLRKIAAER
jgi:tetraacyldisaccharide 4'-kinase